MNYMQQQNQNQMQALNPGKYKTQLCRHFKNGNCTLNTTCHFAHGVQELRGYNDPLPQQLPVVQPKVAVNNFKTVKCKFHEQGFCKNGGNCHFAHGDVDIQIGQYQQVQYPAQGIASGLGGLTNSPNDPNTQILIMILQNLEQSVFSGKPDVLTKLQSALQYAQLRKNNESTQIIMEIMEDPARTDDEKQKYHTIYSNARTLFQNYLVPSSIPAQRESYLSQDSYGGGYGGNQGGYQNHYNQGGNHYMNGGGSQYGGHMNSSNMQGQQSMKYNQQTVQQKQQQTVNIMNQYQQLQYQQNQKQQY